MKKVLTLAVAAFLFLFVSSQPLTSSSVSGTVTHIAVSANGVFVSTATQVYRFSPTLQQIGDPLGSLGGTVNGIASTSDGEWCIVCTDAGGITCSVLNGSNLEAPANRTVTNGGTATSLVVFTGGDGNSFYTGSYVNQHILYHQYGFAGSTQSRSTNPVHQQASGGFNRVFVSGFFASGYAYYIVSDPPTSGVNRRLRIIRVCNDSAANGFNNQYELTLGCDGNNAFFNPTLIDVSVINEETTLLITIRADSVDDICSYNLSEINSLMDAAYQSCVVDGTGDKNVFWQSSVTCSGGSSGLSGSICSISDSRSGTPAPAVGVSNPLTPTGLVTNTTILNGLTAIVGLSIDDIDFIYFAFTLNSNNYYISKYQLVNSTTLKFISQVTSTSTVTLLSWSQGSEYVYGISGTNVISLKIEDCSSATSCSECVSLGDPLCGWCMIENKCSRRPFCQETRQYLTQYRNCFGESYNNSANTFNFGLMRNFFAGYFSISTLSPLNVTYNITVQSLNYTRNGTVTKNRPSTAYFSSSFQTHSSSFENRYKGVHVTSDQPISVMFFNYFLEHLMLPNHEYPGVSQYEYYAVSTSSYYNEALSQVLLVGCVNNTVISIIPTVDLFIPIDVQKNESDDILVTKGNSHTITLHEGQTLLLGKGNGSDISGTHFISNKPLTVITGHECGSTPNMLEFFTCHYLQLQVPPTVTWGKRFILTNFINLRDRSLYSSYIKTVTSQANTSITIYCDETTNTTRYSTNGAVGTYQYNITEYCYIEANKPIFVVLFPHSYFSYRTTMVLISPVEKYLREVNFEIIGFFYDYSKLVITASVEEFSSTAILHNGLATLNWTAIYDSKRNIVAYGTEIEINRYYSNHSVVHTGKNGKLSVQVQGQFYVYTIYGWPAVVSLDQNVVCNFSCGNGICVADNLCQCFEGWTGDQCDEVLCSPVCGNGYCVPTNSCVCNPGWTGDRCRTDINECNFDVCSQICINTQGSYTCECNMGYQFRNDNLSCEDINECETVDHNCTQTCSNTVGSYTCSCRTGYKDNGYGNCTDIDECSMGTSGCQQLCFNTNGSYYCQCNTGYKLMNDNSSCDDINECIEDPGVCPLRSNCINTLGSYQCNCIDGYQMDNTGMCIDIDECVTGTHSCQQRCINTQGSYNCSCYDGFIKRFELFCFGMFLYCINEALWCNGLACWNSLE